MAQSQLADAAQALKSRMIDELKNKWMANGDKTINGIVDYFSEELGHTQCNYTSLLDELQEQVPKM